jgi:DHA1 family bicyclomycin/chloramphenicol resistance-like MFS transporter
VWFLVPDSLPAEKRVRLGLAALMARYLAILRERGFITHALTGGGALFAVFAYLGGSPGVFIDMLHVSPPVYGMLFGSCATFYIVGTQINGVIVPRIGLGRAMRIACRIMLVADAVLMAVAVTGPHGVLPFFLPIMAIMACNGFISPNAAVGALSRHAAHAGSASAIMGTMQFMLGAVSGSLVGVLDDGTARPMAGLMLLGAIGAVVADFCRPRT